MFLKWQNSVAPLNASGQALRGLMLFLGFCPHSLRYGLPPYAPSGAKIINGPASREALHSIKICER